MHPDRFTVKSQEALAAAQRLAGARGNPEVAPQHLLVALLEQPGQVITKEALGARMWPDVVVSVDGAAPTTLALQEFLGRRLPGHMVHSAITDIDANAFHHFSTVALPTTAAGC